MLLPLITDEIISGHLILWPSFGILILSFVFVSVNTIRSDALVNTIYCSMLLIFILGIIESIASGIAIASIKDDELPVISVKTYPIEYREETNKLYVFFPETDSYSQAAHLTKEFVKPGDTLYIAERIIVGKNLWWSTTTTTSTKPPLNFESAKQDTVKLFYNDGKFQAITPTIPTTLEKDSTP